LPINPGNVGSLLNTSIRSFEYGIMKRPMKTSHKQHVLESDVPMGIAVHQFVSKALPE